MNIIKTFKGIFKKTNSYTWGDSFTYNGYTCTITDFNEEYIKNFIVSTIIERLSTDIASLEINEELLPKENRFWEIIKNPNQYQTWYDFMKELNSWFEIDGVVFVYQVLNDDGKTLNSIYVLPKKDVKIIGDAGTGDIISYEIKQKQGNYITVKNYNERLNDPRNTVFMIKDFNSNSRYACDLPPSKLESVCNQLEYISLANRYSNNFLKKGAKPSVAIKVESKDGFRGKLSDTQKAELKAAFIANYVGSENAGSPIILEEGVDLKTISTDIDKLNFDEGIENSIVSACMRYFVPLEVIGYAKNTSGGQYKVSDDTRKFYMNNAVLPRAKNIYAKLNQNFMFRYGKNELSFDVAKIPTLMAERFSLLESMERSKTFTINERRQYANKEQLDGLDVIMVGLNEADARQSREKEPIDNNAI